MADARHFCPDCGSISLTLVSNGSPILHDPSRGVVCGDCNWSGKMSDTIGAVTTEQFWDINRVGNVLLRVVAKHAAGPLVQSLEFVGLIPRIVPITRLSETETSSDEEANAVIAKQLAERDHNEAAQKVRDTVMQRICEAAITAAFEEAEKANRLFAAATGAPVHPMLIAEDTADKEFGGNVVPIKKKRKRRKR